MKQIHHILAGLLLLVMATACEKDTDAEIFAPKVTTGTATGIYRKGATLSGSIALTETSIVDRYGILFSNLQSMAEYKELTVTTGESDFSMSIQDLEPGETYYFCSYAHSGYSIVRGEVRSFTTSQSNAPIFDTPVISETGESFFTVSSTLLDEGGSEVMLSGFCYNEAGEDEPTFMDNVVNVETSGNSISATINGLQPGKTYQVRAYGASGNGLAYSGMVTVTTGEAVVPFLSPVEFIETTLTSMTIKASVLEAGSAEVTDVGFCLSTTNPEPTMDDECISCGKDMEEFGLTKDNLTPGTTYYIRAYAVNEYGIGYSETLEWTSNIAEVAYLYNGSDFNSRIRQLANGGEITFTEADSIIRKIEFKTNVYSHSSEDYEDISENAHVPIYASFNKADGLLTVYTPSNRIEVMDASYLFFHLEALQTIDFGNFNITETTTAMNSMFAYCKSLTSLDVSNWNTEKVTSIRAMFSGCSSLTTLDLSNWDTSNVTEMHTMFGDCYTLTSLNVSKWDTSKVTTMASMFFCCKALTSLDISNWDTSNVTEMYFMFEGCQKLTSLNVSKWNTSNVTTMHEMFRACYELNNLDISSWNTSNVTNMDCMFGWCHNLPSLDLSKWDTSKVTDINEMFIQCTGMTTLNLSNWDISNVTNMDKLFRDCYSLTQLNISNWNLNKSLSYTEMFENCTITSKLCEITATQVTQDFLLGITETTGMEPSHYIWVNANAGSGNSFEDIPNQGW